MVRESVVAGVFYPGTKEALLKNIDSFVDKTVKPVDAIGVLVPHAGYIYSGGVAGSVFSSIEPKTAYLILGPNHTGMGEHFGLSSAKAWKTPLGEVTINRKLAEAILAASKYVKEDDESSFQEHSIEVQLPFLQYFQKDFTFVPIVISYAALDVYRAIGREVAGAIKKLGLENDICIIASSDMTHYESQSSAKKKDSMAMEAVLKLDEAALVKNISEFDISMCGYAACAIMIQAVKELGAKHAKIVKYATSGDASGDYSSVVGYAGIAVTKT